MNDISEIVPFEREIELTRPGNDKPLGIHIALLPMSDAKVKTVERRIQNEINKMKAKGKLPKAHEIEAYELELVMAAMIGWRWEGREEPENDLIVDQPQLDGEEHPAFTPKNITRLLKVGGGWAKKQIDLELGNDGDFFAI